MMHLKTFLVILACGLMEFCDRMWIIAILLKNFCCPVGC